MADSRTDANAGGEQPHSNRDARGNELVIEGQKKALELAVHGAPLGEVLEVIVRTVEAQSPTQVLGSILLLDADGKHLRHGAAPSLPAEYNAAIDGISIGPTVGSCGTAAFTGNTVVVSDILVRSRSQLTAGRSSMGQSCAFPRSAPRGARPVR